MAETFKDKVEDAGHKLAEKATKAGHVIGEKVEEATDWAKEKAHQAGNRIEEMSQKVQHKTEGSFGETGSAGTVSDITEHMDVLGSCGNKLGKVDLVVGDSIKLTKHDSPDGVHHMFPLSWVKRVDEHVHLNKSCGEAKKEWLTV